MSWEAAATAAATLFGIVVALAGLWKIVAEVAKMRAELKPNGGSSLRDAVARIETDLDNLHSDVRQLRHENSEDRAAAKEDRAALMQVIDERDATHASLWRAVNSLKDLHHQPPDDSTIIFPPSRGRFTDDQKGKDK